jgi:hypothetical protein
VSDRPRKQRKAKERLEARRKAFDESKISNTSGYHRPGSLKK